MVVEERCGAMLILRRVAGTGAALLDLWLVVIATSGAALAVLAAAVAFGLLPREALPPADAPQRLANEGQQAWGAVVESVRSAGLALPAAPGRECRVVLGFAKLEGMIGHAITGECLEDERTDAEWGIAVQATTGGLFAFRPEGTLAFTDGYRTWLLGRAGLQRRLNGQRWCWEADAEPRTCLRA